MEPELTQPSGKKSRAWLFAAAVVAAVVLGVVAWLLVHGIGWLRFRRTVAELRARGEVLDVEALAPPAVPDEENAAVILKPVLERARDFGSELLDDPELEDWYGWALFRKELGERRSKLREALSRHEEIFKLTAEALKRPGCRFVDYSTLPPPMNHLVGMRPLGRLFQAKLRLELEEDPEKAPQTLEHLLLIAGTLNEEPLLMSQMTRVALFDFFAESLRIAETRGMAFPPERRKGLILKLKGAKFEESFLRALMMERARIARTSFREDAEAAALWMDIRPPVLPGTVESLRAGLISELTRMTDGARESHAEFSRIALKEAVRWSKKAKEDIAAFQLQAWYKAYLSCMNRAASRDLARVALALGLYKGERGDYPEKLDALAPHFPEGVPVDVFTGDPLAYRKTGNGFLLYSLGPDGKDDGGTTGKQPLWPFDGDICWRHPMELGAPVGNGMAPAVAKQFEEFLDSLLRVARSTLKGSF